MPELDLTPEIKYENLINEQRRIWKLNLKLDRYYQTEQDGDTWYSGFEFNKRAKSIDKKLQMTSDEIEKEIQIKATSIAFAGVKPSESLSQIRENKTIFIPESNLTPIISTH